MESWRRAHPFFVSFALSLLSMLVFLSTRAVSYYPDIHLFSRQSGDRPGSASPVANITGSTQSMTTPTVLRLSSSESSTRVSSKSSTFSVTPTTLVQTTSRTSLAPTTSTLSEPPTSTLSSTITDSLTTSSTPTTTSFLVVTDSSTSTSTTDSSTDSSATVTPENATSSANQFWDNKGAVAATFLFAILFGVAIAVMIVIFVLKRRNAKRQALIEAEFMPTYPEQKSQSSSPTPSITSSPLDPFSRREIIHDNIPTGITDANLNSSTRTIPAVQSSLPPSYYSRPHYIPQSQLLGVPNTAADSQRHKAKLRGSAQSGYQPSLDSFYGAYSPTTP